MREPSHGYNREDSATSGRQILIVDGIEIWSTLNINDTLCKCGRIALSISKR